MQAFIPIIRNLVDIFVDELNWESGTKTSNSRALTPLSGQSSALYNPMHPQAGTSLLHCL